MKVFVCYADEVYEKAQKSCLNFAYKRGKFDQAIGLSKADLPEEFVQENERFFKYRRGGGYWIWKSYVINETLKKLQFGDYLFYSDTGALIVRPIDKLISVMEKNHEDIMLFEVYGRLEREWTKRDVFTYLDYDVPECANTAQMMSGYILIKKTPHTVQFVEEWVQGCQHGMLISDEPNEGELPNYEGFRENRHDQSVLSVLAKKHGIIPYKDPSQWGLYQNIQYRKKCFGCERDYMIYERSPYPLMIWGHRYKVVNLRNMLASVKNFVQKYIKRSLHPDSSPA